MTIACCVYNDCKLGCYIVYTQRCTKAKYPGIPHTGDDLRHISSCGAHNCVWFSGSQQQQQPELGHLSVLVVLPPPDLLSLKGDPRPIVHTDNSSSAHHRGSKIVSRSGICEGISFFSRRDI